MLETQTLHEAGTYQEQLISSIDGASDRVLLETMVLDHLDGMEPVMDAVLRARQRGAAALVIYDHIFSQGSLRSKYGPGALRDFQSRMQELEDNGVEVHRVGKRELNPFAGRHHAKAVVVDNHAYV